MSIRTKPLDKQALDFCRFHLGKDCFAPFTGGDWPAWRAFVYLVECYAHGGGQDALVAMRATVRCAQRSCSVLECFVQAIPAVMDWGDVRRLWPTIADGIRLIDAVPSATGDARHLFARERSRVEGRPDDVVVHGASEMLLREIDAAIAKGGSLAR